VTIPFLKDTKQTARNNVSLSGLLLREDKPQFAKIRGWSST